MDKEFSFDLKENQSENLAKLFMLDELEKIHKRFENGTETIDDIINHCTNYLIGFSDRPELNVVEKKYFDRLVNYVKDLQQEIENWKFTDKYVKDNYIYKEDLEKILNKHKKTPLEQGYLFYIDIKKLLEEK